MKKGISLLTVAMLALSLSACGGTADLNSEPSDSTVQESAGVTEAHTESSTQAPGQDITEEPPVSFEAEPADEDTEATGGTLIAYFSWSGNTEQMAQFIQDETGGELFTIEPAIPYTDDYDTLLDIAQQEQADNARPELASQVENWDSYEVIFVGYPDWWSDAPMLIYSFLESYDWTGKTLIPFCTSGGSGFGRSLDKLPNSTSGATILEGLHINGDSVDGAAEDVAAWIDDLGL